MEKEQAERVGAMSTRGEEYVNALRASMWKTGERNIIKNLTDGSGYEGVTEIWKKRPRM